MAHSREVSVICYLTSVFILLVTSSLVLSEEVPYASREARSVRSIVIDYQLKEHSEVQRFRRDVNSTNNDIPTDATNTNSSTDNSSSNNSNNGITSSQTTPVSSTTVGTTHTTVPPTTTIPPKYVNDTHNYYTSEILQDKVDDHWDNYIDGHRHKNLSDSHRVAVTLPLPFSFRFYGHNITNVTVATGGFMYMSPFIHHWLTATQYAAPLMANFDTSKGNHSDVYYKSYTDKFVVHWSNVYLRDQKSEEFDFQAILFRDGTIKFVYKKVPLDITLITDDNHPVKVGLSDAFYIDTYVPLMGYTRRTIYEYHRVTLVSPKIKSGAVIILKPLKTCNTCTSCQSCTEHKDINFPCQWCSTVNRCSDGIDWHRQEWLQKGCKDDNLNKGCPVTTTKAATTMPKAATEATNSVTVKADTSKVATTTQKPVDATTVFKFKTTVNKKTTTATIASEVATTTPTHTDTVTKSQNSLNKISVVLSRKNCMHLKDLGNCTFADGFRGVKDKDNDVTAIIIVVCLLIIALIAGIGGWIFYAYTHPTSSSGMWLMEHRPSQMKSKLGDMKFWKKSTPSGEKYQVESHA